MRTTICIAVAAAAIALPQLANANSRTQDHAAFTHWWSMGSAGPEPVQNIDGKDFPGAPNGMLAEMNGRHAASAKGTFAGDID